MDTIKKIENMKNNNLVNFIFNMIIFIYNYEIMHTMIEVDSIIKSEKIFKTCL